MCECDRWDDDFEPCDELSSRDEMIRDLVEDCDSLADIRAIAREMVAELRRQKILRRAATRAARRISAPDPPPPAPKTPEELYLESLPDDYRAKIAARGPVVMSPAEIEQMKRDVAAVEKRQQLYHAANILGIKWE